MIAGFGDVLEINEVHLFKPHRKMGKKMVNIHYWVVGGISRTTKRMFLVQPPLEIHLI